VFENVDDSLCFLIHPEWRTIVCGNDLRYLESLFEDFRERAKLCPAALFKQLSSLAVGRLVSLQVGTNISDYPFLLKLCSCFVWL
jgi:hypothetical protein